jgi:hypothetical protein
VHNEAKLSAFLVSCFTPMIAVPGHPTSGPFYLVKGLLNAANRFPWQPASAHKLTVYIRLIPLLSAFGQPNLPFHVPGVESNDVLYNSADEYLAELAGVTNETVQSALALLKEIGDSGNAGVEASLALQLAQEVGCVSALWFGVSPCHVIVHVALQMIRCLELNDKTVPIVVQLLLRVKHLGGFNSPWLLVGAACAQYVVVAEPTDGGNKTLAQLLQGVLRSSDVGLKPLAVALRG